MWCQKASGRGCNVLRENTRRNVAILTKRYVVLLIKTERYVVLLIKANTAEEQAKVR